MTRHLLAVALLILGLAAPAVLHGAVPAQRLKGRFASAAEQQAVILEIVDQGPRATADLMALLREEAPLDPQAAMQQWQGKVSAMNLLGELRAQESLDLLGGMLQRADTPSAIHNSARTIGRIGGAKAFRILAAAYRANRSAQRPERLRAVLAGLGLCGDKRAIPMLKEALANHGLDVVIRVYAAGSLGLLGSQDGLEVATLGLKSEDPDVRLASTRALGLIGAPYSIEELSQLARPEADFVSRKTAQLAIAQIETEQLPDADKPAHLRQLLLDHPRSTETIQWGTDRLKRLGSPAAKKALQELAALEGADQRALKGAAMLRAKTMN